MRTPAHLVVGAVVGALPDVVLVFFGWRKQWLPETHPLVRAHRALHSFWSIPAVFITAAWASHIVTDRFSTHRTERTRRGRFL